MFDPDTENLKDIESAYERGRYQVMHYFLTLVEKRPGGISDKQIIETMSDIYKKELEELDWIRLEMQELSKKLQKLQ
jgi:hypothetical protein